MRLAVLVALVSAAALTGCGGDETPEQRLRDAGFKAEGQPNFLTLFGDRPIDHGVLLRKGALVVALVEFEIAPPSADESTDQVVVGKTLIALVTSETSDDLQRQFADAVRVARG